MAASGEQSAVLQILGHGFSLHQTTENAGNFIVRLERGLPSGWRRETLRSVLHPDSLSLRAILSDVSFLRGYKSCRVSTNSQALESV